MKIEDKIPTELAAIEERLANIEVMLKSRQFNLDDVFLDNQDFLMLMNVSKRTAQQWRTDGVIAFSQVGGKIYYSMSDQRNGFHPILTVRPFSLHLPHVRPLTGVREMGLVKVLDFVFWHPDK